MKRQFFAPIGSGMGDVIVSIPVLHALIGRGNQTYLIANSQRQLGLDSCVPGLAGTIPRPEFQKMTREPDDDVYDFLSHPMQADHVWGSADFEKQFPAIRITDILKMICTDFSIDADFNKIAQIPCEPRAEFSGYVVLIPGTVTNAKSWPLNNWFQLYHRLKDMSNKVVMLGEPQRNSDVAKLIDGGIPWVETPHIMDGISIISAARLAIAVDTGLMHIAVTQGIETIALFEHSPIYYHSSTNCRPLFAARCQPECLRDLETFVPTRADSPSWDWYQGSFLKCKAPESQRCMSAICVADVLGNLTTISCSG